MQHFFSYKLNAEDRAFRWFSCASRPIHGKRIYSAFVGSTFDRPRGEQKHPDSKTFEMVGSRGNKCPTFPIEVSEQFYSPRAVLQHTESRSQGKV